METTNQPSPPSSRVAAGAEEAVAAGAVAAGAVAAGAVAAGTEDTAVVSKVGYFTFYNLVAVSFVVIAVYIVICSILFIKSITLDYPAKPLQQMTSPIPVAGTRQNLHANAMLNTQMLNAQHQSESFAVYGQRVENDAYKPLLYISRPFDSDNEPDNYYGTFATTKFLSATLTGLSVENGGYFEVVVYSYPDFKPVYAETNIPELAMDFLPPGVYSVFVFSAVSAATGFLVASKNTKRPRPLARRHRSIPDRSTTDAYEMTALTAVESEISALTDLTTDTLKSVKIASSPSPIWPKPIFTRVETVYAVVPAKSNKFILPSSNVYITVPSFGVIVGGTEHIGPLVHEGHNFCVYRAISLPPAVVGLSGKTPSTSSTGQPADVVCVSVAYPDFTTDVSVSAVPPTSVYAYSSKVSKQSHGRNRDGLLKKEDVV